MHAKPPHLLPAILAILSFSSLPAEESALDIFQRRILPILRSPNPSSCAECHLSGVDLKDYIRESPKKTFLSLRNQGLVDLETPQRSRILDLIRMSQPNSSLITREKRQEELEAFAAWLQACARDPQLRSAPPLPQSERAGPAAPEDVIRHTRTDRVLESFVINVWAQIQRCAGCHAPGGRQSAKNVREYGERVLWARRSPRETLNTIVEHKLIDTESPAESLLLAKPTLQKSHEGGRKMEIGDDGYKQFRRFIEDYASSVRGEYRRPEDLPSPSSVAHIPSEVWLKVTPTPAAWTDKLVGIRIDRFNPQRREWESEPIALAERRVHGPQRFWQQALILLAPVGSAQARRMWRQRRLPAGRYRLRFYVDLDGKLKQDWRRDLATDEFFAGAVELTANWLPGYGRMTVTAPPQATSHEP